MFLAVCMLVFLLYCTADIPIIFVLKINPKEHNLPCEDLTKTDFVMFYAPIINTMQSKQYTYLRSFG